MNPLILPRWQRASATALAFAASIALGSAQQPLVERVDVSRVLIDARVLDDHGSAVTGLGPSDFVVRIDGDSTRVESVEWIEGRSDASADVAGFRGGREPRQTPGRLIVMLVQKDLEPSRAVGLMATLQVVEPLLQQLRSDDRVAVLSFDSRLRAWTDFTDDVARVRAVLKSVLRERPPAIAATGIPSLFARLDLSSARRTGSLERSLQMIGEALEPLPGAKSLVLLGYGFGRFNPSTLGVTLMDGYDEARQALQGARTSVFSLNTTRAHFNSLQQGLQAVSAATGGFYASTFEFPTRAIERVVQALRGHYVLFVDKPPSRAGYRRIDVRLAERHGTVFARSGYFD